MGLTTDPQVARNSPILPSGQQETYVILSEEERAKGFVRPVMRSYQHIGQSVCGGLAATDDNPFARVTPDPADHRVYMCCGEPGHEGRCSDQARRAVTEQQREDARRTHLFGGCGGVTTMARAIAETYARDPKFYGATFCCNCGSHLKVGMRGEFVWCDDGTPVGSTAEEAAAIRAQEADRKAELNKGAGI